MIQLNIGIYCLCRVVVVVVVLMFVVVGVFMGIVVVSVQMEEGELKLVVYVEVNLNDLVNVVDYMFVEFGGFVVDLVMIFVVNINYDGQKVYLYFNECVMQMLQDVENQICFVQVWGIKVFFLVFGNYQGVGFVNFMFFV